ncbi:Serpin-ZX [Rhynchospora pubera]|uniref:Serpin-ZX n=1 Tax=Rhynchospora pubera TaxID=906938 RepID=A0AAV8HNR7_9POAL|nr:Serpin-ZX [Rhynchospora pubera]
MDMREAIAAQTSFSLRLSSHLLSLNGSAGFNLAFSPLSLHSVLSLLTAGSSGPTHQQLLWFLGCPLASNLVALYFQISNSILVDGSAVGGPCICYAGGVWVDASVNLKNSFREVAGSVYKAEAHSVPFRALPEECRNQINNWVQEMTAGHIKDLLPSGSVTVDTRLVLGNAM